MAGEGSPLYLGVEISTQQAKIIAIDDALAIVYQDALNFDTDLQEFRTQGGVHIHEDKLTVTSPTLMWVKAVDQLLSNMKRKGFAFKQVAAISGTGQQHGSVYWKNGSSKVLSTLQPEKSFHEQLENVFSITDSPIWMDSSTSEQCRNLEERLGGAEIVSKMTGSRAYERFTGNQIAKIYQNQPEKYQETEFISLVSSFACSLFLGRLVPVDYSDGSGMNLLNISDKMWNQACLDACAPELQHKLGEAVPSYQCMGQISDYLVDRFGFNPDCKIIAFTGDNPASVAGMQLKDGEVIVSLGTSDTVFLWLNEPKPALEGHIFVNPVDPAAYMALLCFKNGSLTRERIRDGACDGSWDSFSDRLNNTPRGNNGNIGIYFDVQEITPSAVGDHRFDGDDKPVKSFAPDLEVRALIEGQFLAKRAHAENLGYKIEPNTRVLATGGASSNKAILQVLSDVFNAPVFVQSVANSACLGCCYRAKHGFLGGDKVKFSTILENAPEFTCAATPHEDSAKIYTPMVARYRRLEEGVVKMQQKS